MPGTVTSTFSAELGTALLGPRPGSVRCLGLGAVLHWQHHQHGAGAALGWQGVSPSVGLVLLAWGFYSSALGPGLALTPLARDWCAMLRC